MFMFESSDLLLLCVGALLGGTFNAGALGVFWGSLILLIFGKIIHVGPGHSGVKSWPIVRRCLDGFLLHLNDGDSPKYEKKGDKPTIRSGSDRVRGPSLRRNSYGSGPRLSI